MGDAHGAPTPGYATEAARALIDFACGDLKINRIVAAADYGNVALQAVMQALGMRIERNPLPEPAWFRAMEVLDYER